MDHAIEFIETHLFTKQIKALVTDDELRVLQHELIAQPTKGDLFSRSARGHLFAYGLPQKHER